LLSSIGKKVNEILVGCIGLVFFAEN